ncbi:hypothetical protein OJF2_57790 [Aquisphaera giovannonii]|uniref:Uncharacterized protein n=1 Tax=Aquisphaera giovannonii TaxID=406548 RepID=A0A5B9W9D0_9BACT|nr:hypothetical protein [Aquisphaera giovannonii]QEH37192.1 hypothetical protein OJF2_57790 [Aquisphaera giovannonii]
MSTLSKRMISLLLPLAGLAWAESGAPCLAQDQPPAAAGAAAPQGPAGDALPPPQPIRPDQLVPQLKTIPVRKDRPSYNLEWVDSSVQPRDKEGIWILSFAYKPLRIQTVEIPGKGRQLVYYLYYKVVNRTGAPRMFVPQFTMVNEEGKRFDDQVIPEAIPVIRAHNDATIDVQGAVNIMGMIPPSTKKGVDDAVFGVATWQTWDRKADRFSIYVRGLSDGYKEIADPSGGKPVVKYKTLRLDFIRRGDEHNVRSEEIEVGSPPYEWVYW